MQLLVETKSEVDAPLADKIRAALARQEAGAQKMEEGRRLWVDATYALCLHLAEARGRFPANQEFADWLDAEGIAISKDDRAAYIALGQEPARAREVLEGTTKTSIRRIASTEFRLRSPANTNRVGPASSSHSQKSSSHTLHAEPGKVSTGAPQASPCASDVAPPDEQVRIEQSVITQYRLLAEWLGEDEAEVVVEEAYAALEPRREELEGRFGEFGVLYAAQLHVLSDTVGGPAHKHNIRLEGEDQKSVQFTRAELSELLEIVQGSYHYYECAQDDRVHEGMTAREAAVWCNGEIRSVVEIQKKIERVLGVEHKAYYEPHLAEVGD